jgi:hypothetical protein
MGRQGWAGRWAGYAAHVVVGIAHVGGIAEGIAGGIVGDIVGDIAGDTAEDVAEDVAGRGVGGVGGVERAVGMLPAVSRTRTWTYNLCHRPNRYRKKTKTSSSSGMSGAS